MSAGVVACLLVTPNWALQLPTLPQAWSAAPQHGPGLPGGPAARRAGCRRLPAALRAGWWRPWAAAAPCSWAPRTAGAAATAGPGRWRASPAVQGSRTGREGADAGGSGKKGVRAAGPIAAQPCPSPPHLCAGRAGAAHKDVGPAPRRQEDVRHGPGDLRAGRRGAGQASARPPPQEGWDQLRSGPRRLPPAQVPATPPPRACISHTPSLPRSASSQLAAAGARPAPLPFEGWSVRSTKRL